MLTPTSFESPTSGGHEPGSYRLTHTAMATQWELYCFAELQHDCEHAGELAFEEVDEIEERLSFFLEGSDIGRLNEASANEPVRVSADAIECLLICRAVHAMTGGAFDPTAGALLTGRQPWHLSEVAPPEGVPPEASDPGRAGFETILIDPEAMTLTRQNEQVRIDLGAVGKGFAVDRAIEVLGDWLDGSAMLVAGQSTMRPLGGAGGGGSEGERSEGGASEGGTSGGEGWLMRIHDPRGAEGEQRRLDLLEIETQAISAAGVGASGHVLDPRTGQATEAAIGAWAVAGSGARSDALATASLVMSGEQLADCCKADPALALARLTGEGVFETYGQWDALRGTLVSEASETSD